MKNYCSCILVLNIDIILPSNNNNNNVDDDEANHTAFSTKSSVTDDKYKRA